MTKDDYMKLSKERLAELLAERDVQRTLVMPINYYEPPCFNNGPCTNPFHDCINCPRQFSGGTYTTTTNGTNIRTDEKST